MFKYKAKEFTKKYATGIQDTKENTSGPSEKTRMVGLKELESLSEGSDSPSATSLSRSALCLKTGSSAPATAPTERISLARPTHKKLTLSRRSTASVAASAALVLSAPFVAPRRKMSADQGAVAESPKISLATREVTPDKVRQEESAPATHLVKEVLVPEPAHLSQSKSLPQKSSCPSLQDTIPATRITSQITSPGTDPAKAALLETETTKMDRKRGAASIKNEESTTDPEVTTKKIKSKKRLMLGSKPLKRLSSPVKETSKYFSGPPSPLPTPTETTKSTPKEPGVIEDVSPPQDVLTQEPVLQPPLSPNIPGTAEDLLPVSPYSKNKGKGKAVDDEKMDMNPRETDQNESMNRTAHRRQDHAFSFMDDISPTVTTTGSTEALTVAKKRNLLKKNRK